MSRETKGIEEQAKTDRDGYLMDMCAQCLVNLVVMGIPTCEACLHRVEGELQKIVDKKLPDTGAKVI